MSKRRIEDEEESDIDISSTDSLKEASDNQEQEEEEIINIDFDFFDINKDIDFHAIKNLLRQLIGEDSKKLPLSELTELALEAPTTTIKTDGKESDPYAFLSPINLKEIKNNEYVKYVHKSSSELSNLLNKISNKKNALLLSERLINMPIQVIPAIYKIVLEEIEKTEGKHYDHYLIPSRKYEVNEETEDNSKKKIRTTEVDYYHHEDQFLEANAKSVISLPAKRGVIQTFIVIDHDGLNKAIGELEDAIAQFF